MKVQKIYFTRRSLQTSFKPVLKCNQVDNNNLKKNIFKRSKFSKKKEEFLEFWKLGAVHFCTVKTFVQFLKIKGGRCRTTKQLFFFWLYNQDKWQMAQIYQTISMSLWANFVTKRHIILHLCILALHLEVINSHPLVIWRWLVYILWSFRAI